MNYDNPLYFSVFRHPRAIKKSNFQYSFKYQKILEYPNTFNYSPDTILVVLESSCYFDLSWDVSIGTEHYDGSLAEVYFIACLYCAQG